MNDGYSKRRLDKIVALKEAIGFFENKQEMELMSYARKRYLLNIQIAWYRVKKFMPEEKAILTELNAEWKTLYKRNKAGYGAGSTDGQTAVRRCRLRSSEFR